MGNCVPEFMRTVSTTSDTHTSTILIDLNVRAVVHGDQPVLEPRCYHLRFYSEGSTNLRKIIVWEPLKPTDLELVPANANVNEVSGVDVEELRGCKVHRLTGSVGQWAEGDVVLWINDVDVTKLPHESA